MVLREVADSHEVFVQSADSFLSASDTKEKLPTVCSGVLKMRL